MNKYSKRDLQYSCKRCIINIQLYFRQFVMIQKLTGYVMQYINIVNFVERHQQAEVREV